MFSRTGLPRSCWLQYNVQLGTILRDGRCPCKHFTGDGLQIRLYADITVDFTVSIDKSDISCLKNQPGTFPVHYNKLHTTQLRHPVETTIDNIYFRSIYYL